MAILAVGRGESVGSIVGYDLVGGMIGAANGGGSGLNSPMGTRMLSLTKFRREKYDPPAGSRCLLPIFCQ